MKKLVFLSLMLFITSLMLGQTVRNAANHTELVNAISASTTGDIVNITNNIVVSGQITINKTITIEGNGFTLTVPRPGLDEMGRFNSNPSNFRVLYQTGGTLTINDLTLKGGSITASGACISIDSGATLKLNRSIVSNSLSTALPVSGGGGGISVRGLLFLNESYVRRNAAVYGGGLLVIGGAKAYVEKSSLIENRSTGTSGGGGAVEVNGDTSFIYFNNSTLSNNQSTEIGGAINCARGTVYFVNSSATGNVAFGSYSGGAIGNNSGNVYIVNSLLAHNYRRNSGDTSNPSSYILDDIVAYSSGQSGVRMYYSIHHAPMPAGMGANLNNLQYTGSMDGSNNTIFSGGLLAKITNNDGVEIGAQIFRPFLWEQEAGVAPTLKIGSFVSDAMNRGTLTRFASNNNVSPVVAYYHNSSWIDLLGTSQIGQEVLVDQVNSSRANPPARGAIEAETTQTLYIVKVNGASDGSVSGGSIYGDVYPSGTSVTLTALPHSGYSFLRWDYVAGGSGTASTQSTYTFTVEGNVTLLPVFTTSSGGQYTITYVGNEHSGGNPPETQTLTGPGTISDRGTLTKAGYSFAGWNTNSNGSGTAYQPGNTYSAGVNLILYAQWQRSAADFPQDVQTGVDGGHLIEPSVDLFRAASQDISGYPNVNNPGFEHVYHIVLSGSGSNVSIRVHTLAPWGAIYFGGAWRSAANSGNQVLFTGVDFDSKGDVPLILGNLDPTLPVELSSFTATMQAGAYVSLAWIVQSETNHAGYNVLRAETNDLSSAYIINFSLITQGSSQGTQITYSLTDNEIYPNSTYYYWLQSISLLGEATLYGPLMVLTGQIGGEAPPSILPETTMIGRVYPNPFNPSTTISYDLAQPGEAKISIYTAKGQLVYSYTQNHANAGVYKHVWNGNASDGTSLSSGVYFIRLLVGSTIHTKRISLVK